MLEKKVALEKEKKVLEESAAEKDALLQKKVKTIGNYVHDSVPVSNNEVLILGTGWVPSTDVGLLGPERLDTDVETRGRKG